MPIMPTSMHLSVVYGPMGNSARFMDVKSIHIGTQAYGAVAGATAPKHPHYPRDSNSPMYFQAPLFQFLGDDLSGAMLFEAGLGMPVQVLPQTDKFGFILGEFESNIRCH